MIHLIGDSHIQSFNDEFKKLWIRAPTAYNNIKHINSIDNYINQFQIKNSNDFIFFSFGEIDIRCHLGFISDKDRRSKEDVIDECIQKYENFMNYYKNFNYNIGIYGVIPSGPYDGIQGNGRNSYKTFVERNEMTFIFNEKLKNICVKNNFLFKTLFYDIINEKKNYLNYFSNDGMHLNGGMFKNNENGINCEMLLSKLFEDLL